MTASIAACAPNVGPVTMSAVVAYESGWQPYATRDNTAGRSYYPASPAAAVRLASRLLAEGHDLDVGYAQVNVSNFAAYGLDAANAYDPCRNVAAGGAILTAAYRRAVRVYGPGQVALAHALCAYNTGTLTAGAGYARGVWREGLRLRAAIGPVRIVVRRGGDGRALPFVRGAGAR